MIILIPHANKGQGDSREAVTTYTPSRVSAEKNLCLSAGKDVDVIGSKVQGSQIAAKVGGNLHIETLQDKETYREQNTSAGIGVSWSLHGGAFSKPTFGGDWSKGNIDSHYRSAREQAGFYAGKDGFDIYVQGNTDLKGGMLASKAFADKNHLSTGTFSFSDLENKADYSAIGIGASYHAYGDYDKMKPNAKNKIYNTIGLAPNLSMPAMGKADSSTKSAVAPGRIDIRENPTQDVSVLSRDTRNALNELGRIFDKKTVEEQQELARVFGEEAFRLAHNLRDDGSGRKIAVHAIIGGIMSQITGAGFVSGAIGAGINEAIIREIKKIRYPGTAQIVSAILGGASARISHSNVMGGSLAAIIGTKENAYGERPTYDGAIIYVNEIGYFKIENGIDVYLPNGVPENVYVWLQDPENPNFGWDYKKGDGKGSGDRYTDKVVVYQVYTVIDGKAYGIAILDDTKAEKKERINQEAKLYMEAIVAASNSGIAKELMDFAKQYNEAPQEASYDGIQNELFMQVLNYIKNLYER